MRVTFVEHLPDLIDSQEYAADPDGRRGRVTAEGALLVALGAECMLCG